MIFHEFNKGISKTETEQLRGFVKEVSKSHDFFNTHQTFLTDGNLLQVQDFV